MGDKQELVGRKGNLGKTSNSAKSLLSSNQFLVPITNEDNIADTQFFFLYGYKQTNRWTDLQKEGRREKFNFLGKRFKGVSFAQLVDVPLYLFLMAIFHSNK